MQGKLQGRTFSALRKSAGGKERIGLRFGCCFQQERMPGARPGSLGTSTGLPWLQGPHSAGQVLLPRSWAALTTEGMRAA